MKQKYSLFCYKFQTILYCSKMSFQSSVNLCTGGKNNGVINQKPRRFTLALCIEKTSEESHEGPSCVPCFVTKLSSRAGFSPPNPTECTQSKVHGKKTQTQEPNNFCPGKEKAWNPSSLLGKDTIMRRKI